MGAMQTAAGNQTNANSAHGMEMTAKHQRPLGVTASVAGICSCVYHNGDIKQKSDECGAGTFFYYKNTCQAYSELALWGDCKIQVFF